jgi:hypothetical protein
LEPNAVDEAARIMLVGRCFPSWLWRGWRSPRHFHPAFIARGMTATADLRDRIDARSEHLIHKLNRQGNLNPEAAAPDYRPSHATSRRSVTLGIGPPADPDQHYCCPKLTGH